MRTTLDIDDDVLQAAKELARRQKKTAGAVISELTRKALTAPPPAAREPKAVLGAPSASRRTPATSRSPFCGSTHR